ncbi:hypothetical protein GCM10010915_11690 [Microbacterium faecale]|uniref:Uncharacterized protein n=1 Tax=Microbacterium faecale TaxID=1804630 RepID=A0A917DF45_9MICO|nr:hypothetical protein [Microbacterium faecale]GGD32972.1 hypothetical protein GCM10010915_11690 [Microbacterium faecale]
MDITLPSIPAGILTLLSLFAPYAIALINRPEWSATVKKVVAIIVAVVLAGLVMAFYYVYTGEPVPEWPVLVLLAIVVAQASYALVTRSSAKTVEQKTPRRLGGSDAGD